MSETKVRTIEEEVREVEREIENLERELAEREEPIVWGEGAAEELEAKERRRVILPRLLTAAKMKRAELRIERERQAAEELEVGQRDAYDKMQRAEARERRAHEDLMAARSEWSGYHTRLEKIGRRIRDAEKEIEALREGR
jgi:hypothetical protein